jgi:superfamily II DNA or RNA helicase
VVKLKAIVPYDYQIDVYDRAEEKLLTHKSVLLVMSTGAGKTVVAAEGMRRWIPDHGGVPGSHCLFLVTQTDLIWQTLEKLERIGVSIMHDVSIIGGKARRNVRKPIQICTIQSLEKNPNLLKALNPSLIFWDEAHTSCWRKYSDEIRKIDCKHIGLTATPGRGKKTQCMGQKFESAVIGPSQADMEEAGKLVPYRWLVIDNPDRTKLKKGSDGDFTDKSLGLLMDNPVSIETALKGLEAVWTEYFDGERKPAIAFCTNKQHCFNVMKMAKERGISARFIVAEVTRDERKTIIAQLRNGIVELLVSVAALTTGFDCAEIFIGLDMRPTDNLWLHMQKRGRVARSFIGKEWATILDCAGNIRHEARVPAEFTEESALGHVVYKPRPCTNPECKAVDMPRYRGCRMNLRFKDPMAEFWYCSVCGAEQGLIQKVEEEEEKEVQFLEGTIKEVGGATEEIVHAWRAFTHEAALGHQKIYSPGWVKHRMKEIFPDFNPRKLLPKHKRLAVLGQEPSLELMIRCREYAEKHAFAGQGFVDRSGVERFIKNETGLSLVTFDDRIKVRQIGNNKEEREALIVSIWQRMDSEDDFLSELHRVFEYEASEPERLIRWMHRYYPKELVERRQTASAGRV